MRRGANRESVACAAGLNWCSFILLLFATISSYWTWGYAYPPAGSGSVAAVTVSTGPWVAAQAWSTLPVPCNCANGICFNWCFVGTQVVMWGDINAEAACGPNSLVYRKWSGPLGYCSFPGGTPPPTAPPSPLPSGAKGLDVQGDVPEGTTFNKPSQVPALQALMIIATITVFFAAIAGCSDAGVDGGSRGLAATATACSLIAWVFTLAAYCLWAAFPYVQTIQSENPSVWIPVWVNQSGNYMSAIETNDTWYGPGFATALTASILIFIANVIHCLSLKKDSMNDDAAPAKYDNEAFPPQTQPIPAHAVPVAATPVSVGNNIATV